MQLLWKFLRPTDILSGDPIGQNFLRLLGQIEINQQCRGVGMGSFRSITNSDSSSQSEHPTIARTAYRHRARRHAKAAAYRFEWQLARQNSEPPRHQSCSWFSALTTGSLEAFPH